jgi:DNA-binding response OmpR family regulator
LASRVSASIIRLIRNKARDLYEASDGAIALMGDINRAEYSHDEGALHEQAGLSLMPKVLLIEDDESLCRIIVDTLTFHHFTVEMSHDGAEALDLVTTYTYDLILLDWDLPNLPGIRILQALRAQGDSTPILMMTGKGGITDKETGFETGADDYLTKPFNMRELAARAKALLRRPPISAGDILRVDNILLEPSKFRATISDQEIQLTQKEFSLLEFFMRHPGEIFSAEILLERVWRADEDATINGLRACIARLRTKIDGDGRPSKIQNITGVGYKLERT